MERKRANDRARYATEEYRAWNRERMWRYRLDGYADKERKRYLGERVASTGEALQDALAMFDGMTFGPFPIPDPDPEPEPVFPDHDDVMRALGWDD